MRRYAPVKNLSPVSRPLSPDKTTGRRLVWQSRTKSRAAFLPPAFFPDVESRLSPARDIFSSERQFS
ncbi:MAG: hypothetical protein LBB51_02965 [Zoogloeaceae bacterium]|jgi:hypothetical protein|nr:hypothetical protein [Zoogloeaceae bacterium]